MMAGRYASHNNDANFMTVVAETRVEPEELSITFERVKKELGWDRKPSPR